MNSERLDEAKDLLNRSHNVNGDQSTALALQGILTLLVGLFETEVEVSMPVPGAFITPTSHQRRTWCCNTPVSEPHKDDCTFKPRGPLDYNGPVLVKDPES